MGLLKPYIPEAKKDGRRRTSDMREVVNAIFYVLKTGCQWDMLPHDFPAKGTVYHYYNTWRKSGLWQHDFSNGLLHRTCAILTNSSNSIVL